MTIPAYARCMDWPIKGGGLAGCEYWRFSHCEKFPDGIPAAYLDLRRPCPHRKPLPEDEWVRRLDEVSRAAQERR